MLGRRRQIVPLLLLVSLGCFAASVTLRVIDPIVPEIARDLGVPVAAVTWLITAYAFPYALGQPFFGALGDALGKARIIKLCYVALTLLTAAAVLAPGLEALIGLRVLAGLAAGGIVPLAFALVADRVPAEQRATALARLMISGFLAQIVGFACTGVIGDLFGWRWVMAATSLLLAVCCIAMVLLLKPRADVARPPLSLGTALALYPHLLSRRSAWVCYAGSALNGMCLFGVTPFIAVLLERDGIGGVREAGFVLTGLGIGGIGFALAVRWLLRACGGARDMTRLGGLLSLLGFAAVAAAGSWPQYAGGMLVAGLGFYMTHNALVTRVAEIAPGSSGAAMSLFAFCFFAGQAVGAPLFAATQAMIGAGGVFLGIGLLQLGLGLLAASVLPQRPAPD